MNTPVASPQGPLPVCPELISASRHRRVCFEYFPTPEIVVYFLVPTIESGGWLLIPEELWNSHSLPPRG